MMYLFTSVPYPHCQLQELLGNPLLYLCMLGSMTNVLQVCLDNSDTYNSDSAITRTLFGRKNRDRRLKCVLITRIPP